MKGEMDMRSIACSRELGMILCKVVPRLFWEEATHEIVTTATAAVLVLKAATLYLGHYYYQAGKE